MCTCQGSKLSSFRGAQLHLQKLYLKVLCIEIFGPFRNLREPLENSRELWANKVILVSESHIDALTHIRDRHG